MQHTQKVNAVNQYLEALNTQSMALIDSLFADNATLEDPYGAPSVEGIEAIRAFYQHAFDANVTVELEGTVRTAHDCAAFAFQINYQGSLIDAIDVFRFNDEGKVISMKAFWSEDNMRKP